MNENYVPRPVPFKNITHIENEQFRLWLSKFDQDERLQNVQHSIFEVLQSKACGNATLIAALTQISVCCEVRLHRISLPVKNVNRSGKYSLNEFHSKKKLSSANRNNKYRTKPPTNKQHNSLTQYIKQKLEECINIHKSSTDLGFSKKKNLTVKNIDDVRNKSNIVENYLQLSELECTDLKRKANTASNHKETTLPVKKCKLKSDNHGNFKHQQRERLDLIKVKERDEPVLNSFNRSDNKNNIKTTQTGKPVCKPTEIKKLESTESKPNLSKVNPKGKLYRTEKLNTKKSINNFVKPKDITNKSNKSMDKSTAISELKLIEKNLKESESRIDIVQNIMTQISKTFSTALKPGVSKSELKKNNIESRKDILVPDTRHGNDEKNSIQWCVPPNKNKSSESGLSANYSANFETELSKTEFSKNQFESTVQSDLELSSEIVHQNKENDQTSVNFTEKIAEDRPPIVENNVGKIRIRDISTLMANFKPASESNIGVYNCNNLKVTSGLEDKDQLCKSSSGNSGSDTESTKVMETSKQIPKYILESFTKKDLNFMKLYTLKFNELVDSKIEMMGDLLHMGITDALCKKDRLKWAEKLSSDKSIKAEKHRLEKEFHDKMRQRGIEFSAFLGCIMNKFEKTCIEEMFLALYVRLVAALLKIDNENVKNLYLSREIIYNMLRRNNYKNKIVMGVLEASDEVFQKSYCRINSLLKFCNSFYAAEDGTIHKFNADNVEQQQIAEGITVTETKVTPIINKYFVNKTSVEFENSQLSLNSEMALSSFNSENIILSQQSELNGIVNTDKSVPMVNELDSRSEQENFLNNSVSIDIRNENPTYREHSYAEKNCDNSEACTVKENEASQIEVIHISDSEDEVADSPPIVSNNAVSHSPVLSMISTVSSKQIVSNSPAVLCEQGAVPERSESKLGCEKTNSSIRQISGENEKYIVDGAQPIVKNMLSPNCVMVPNTFFINFPGNFKHSTSQQNQSNVISSSKDHNKTVNATSSIKSAPVYLLSVAKPTSKKPNSLLLNRQETNMPVEKNTSHTTSPLLHAPKTFVSANNQNKNLIYVPYTSFNNTEPLVKKLNLNNTTYSSAQCSNSAAQVTDAVPNSSVIVLNNDTNQIKIPVSCNIQLVNSVPGQYTSPRLQLAMQNQFVPHQKTFVYRPAN